MISVTLKLENSKTASLKYWSIKTIFNPNPGLLGNENSRIPWRHFWTCEIKISPVIKFNPTKIVRATTCMAPPTYFGSIVLIGLYHGRYVYFTSSESRCWGQVSPITLLTNIIFRETSSLPISLQIYKRVNVPYLQLIYEASSITMAKSRGIY